MKDKGKREQDKGGASGCTAVLTPMKGEGRKENSEGGTSDLNAVSEKVSPANGQQQSKDRLLEEHLVGQK